MSDLTVNVLITNIINSMSDTLDDEQLKKLKDQLYINLHDVEISDKCYDLATTILENDTRKLEHFIASMKIIRRTNGTIKQYVDSAKKLRLSIGKNFVDITSIDIQFFLAKQKWSDTTMQNNIQYLRAFYGYLQREEIIEKNPMDKIKPVKSEQIIKESFNPMEMEQIRLACREMTTRESALIEFLYATGLRVSEVQKLKWKDLDMHHLSFIVKGKGRKEREVMFSEKSGFYLLRYMDERMEKEHRTKEEMYDRPIFAERKKNPKTKDYEALTSSGIRHIIKELGKKAQVAEIYPHKFRRTFATDAINRGMPLETLRILMGHTKYDTTLLYAHIKTSKINQAYRTYCE